MGNPRLSNSQRLQLTQDGNKNRAIEEGESTMRSVFYLTMCISLSVLLVIIAGCVALPNTWDTGEMPLLFEADFEDGSLDAWQATDPAAWRIEQGRGGKVLAQFEQSNYKSLVHAPRNINLIRNLRVRNFQIELRMRSTTKDSDHRNLCLFFGYRDPRHFYYVHLTNNSDTHANSIFMVDGRSGVSIAKTRTEETKWDDDWHTVRLVRNVDKATIEVYFDEREEPVMTAINNLISWGQVGVGSFDGTGQFDKIRLRGQEK